MAFKKYKNRNYKSSIQTYNGVAQPIAATDIVTDPVNLELGNSITDTGCAIERDFSGLKIEANGLYRISFDADISATAAGAVTLALMIDGVIANETVKVNTVALNGAEEVSSETIRVFQTCCTKLDYNVEVIAFSDGTFAGSVNNISTNIIKLA